MQHNLRQHHTIFDNMLQAKPIKFNTIKDNTKQTQDNTI